MQILPEYLYYLTPSIKLEKILKRGLVPKIPYSGSMIPPRIYFSENIEKLENLSKSFYKNTLIKNWVLLKIDITKTSDNFRLYKDYRTDDGFYTMDNIAPDIIEVLKEINF